MSTRNDILNRIKTTLEASASSLKSVELIKANIPDFNNLSLPCAFVFADSDTRIQAGDDNAVIGRETWDMTVIIEIWTKTTAVETLLAEIHTVMYDDKYFNNLADWSWRTGSDTFVIDPSNDIWGLTMTYVVRFSHTQGVP